MGNLKILHIGDFILHVVVYYDNNVSEPDSKEFGITGIARLELGCETESTIGRDFHLIDRSFNLVEARHIIEVVDVVRYPQTQISLQDAIRYKHDVTIGDTITLATIINKSDIPNTARSPIRARRPDYDIFNRGILVSFQAKKIVKLPGKHGEGKIVEGRAEYPIKGSKVKPFRVQKNDFSLLIHTITISPTRSYANITVQLPPCLSSKDTCGPATLELGKVQFSPDCELYVEKNDSPFGPWIIGDLGLIIEGNGYIADFSSQVSPFPYLSSWKGLFLSKGSASGKDIVYPDSNTGYLTGMYGFEQGIVSDQGFSGTLKLEKPVVFRPTNPWGYTVSAHKGYIHIEKCNVTKGQLEEGSVSCPTTSVINSSTSGPFKAEFSVLEIGSNLDLKGAVTFSPGPSMIWGELTNPSSQLWAWSLEPTDGYFYLPAGPRSSYCPDTGNGFDDSGIATSTLPAILITNGISGISSVHFKMIRVYSEDRPGGAFLEPLSFPYTKGWIHIGACGIDGRINIAEMGNPNENLGNVMRTGYVGKQPFNVSITLQSGSKETYLASFIASAVYDSSMEGVLTIPGACNFTLPYSKMMVTSTADFMGGDITLPSTGVTFDYWQLGLVPTGYLSKAGVLSVRTGRVIFTAAGIREPMHFDQPFNLTWGEIFANGDIGEFFFDFNSHSQRFDKISFTTERLMLSSYHPGATDRYLAVGGTVHFNFFSGKYVNIRDSRYDIDPNPPFNKRYVTIPKSGEVGWPATDLTLHGEWNNSRAVFDFPDATTFYNEPLQNGFKGEGLSQIFFIKSPEIESSLEIRDNIIDIRMHASATHDVDFSFSRFGGIAELHGCIRIEGPLLKRIAIHGMLEKSSSSGTGIFEPKSGQEAEIITSVTPTSCIYYTSGNFTASYMAKTVDLAGSLFLSVDYEREVAEGQFLGRINADLLVGGLSGEGQVTWYTGQDMYFCQGRISMSICSWIGGAGMEGGIFIGQDVPKASAWVLQTGTELYGCTDNVLPETLTGVFGYGRLSMGFNAYIFGGGLELYVGVGVFNSSPYGRGGIHLYGEILGGLVSVEGWGMLTMIPGPPPSFEGSLKLRGCAAWVFCKSVTLSAGFSQNGFYLG